MHYRLFGPVAASLLAGALLCGCGDGRTAIPQSEVEAKERELLELAGRGDFYFDHSYYRGAKKDYEEVVKRAQDFLYYGERFPAVEAILEKTNRRLECEEMTEGLGGRVRMGGRWVDPASYCFEKAREIKSKADGDLALRMGKIQEVLKESRPSPGGLAQSEEWEEILGAGREATAFVVCWLAGDDPAMREMALCLLEAMEEDEDIIFAAALAHLDSDSPSVVSRCVALLTRFPRDETAAALIPMLDTYNEDLLEEVVAALCETKTELGRRVLFDRVRSASRHKPIRQVVLKHVYLLDSSEAVELLAGAIEEAAEDPYQAFIEKVAVASLLKMRTDLPGVLPAYVGILQRADASEREVVVEILKRMREEPYVPARTAVRKVFGVFSSDGEVTGLAVDIMEKIADESSIDLLMGMVFSMDIGMMDVHLQMDTDNLFIRITDIIKRVKGGGTAEKFKSRLSSYQTQETVLKAVHALGVLGEDAAVADIWQVYNTTGSDEVKMAVVSALARIGTQAATEDLAIVIKTAPPGEVLKFATDYVPKLLTGPRAFEVLYSEMGGAPREAAGALFEGVAREGRSWALDSLLRVARGGQDYLRLEVLRAVASFGCELSEAQGEELREIMFEIITALQDELDVSEIERAFSVLRLHVEDAMPVFLKSVRAEYWPVAYYSAEALERASAVSVERHRRDLRAVFKGLRERGDYHSAIRIGRCLRLSESEIEKTVRENEERGRAILESAPAGVGLGWAPDDLRAKVGEEFELVGPEGSPVQYLFYRSRGVVFALRENWGGREVAGIAYLKGFEAEVYGTRVGGDINAVLMIAGPPPDDPSEGVRYLEEFHAFVGHDPLRSRVVFFFLGRGRAVRYVVEIGGADDPKFREEFFKVIEGIDRGD